MKCKVIAALGVLALVVAACETGSSGPKRAVAKSGQIVTVLRGDPDTDAMTGVLYVEVALDRSRTLYAVDYEANSVVRVPVRGRPTTLVASTTEFPPPPNPGRGVVPGAVRTLKHPNGVAVDGAGTVFVSSSFTNLVFGVQRSGKRLWVAGTAEPGEFAPANGPAADVKLTLPGALAVDGGGNLYIENGYTVARLGRDGMVTTVAGTGTKGFSGDGGPATAAQLGGGAITVDGAGNMYIADGSRVRRVDPRGIIQTIAGTGEQGFSGDGGPALQARFESMSGITVDRQGSVFVTTGQRVRAITAAGVVRTIAGTGEKGFSGDGGPATQAQLNGPSGLAVDADGSLYIADDLNHRVRMVGAQQGS